MMRGKRFAALLASACAAGILGVGGSAMAASITNVDAPGWMITTHSYPTNLVPGQAADFSETVFNIGGAASRPGAIVTDTLPAGVTSSGGNGWTCSAGSPVVCTREVERTQSGELFLPSSGRAELRLPVSVGAGVAEGTVTNQVTVSGGGAQYSASVSEQFPVSSTPAGFGFADATAWASNANGTLDTSPGSHPFAFTFAFDINSNAGTTPEGEVRNMTVNLPPGLVGNATAIPRCTREQFDEERCPTGSQIGIAPSTLGGFSPEYVFVLDFPVYNMVPPAGHPAEFAFELFNNQVFLDASVRTGGDYGITEHVTNIPQREIISSDVTIWGAPADASHNDLRQCKDEQGIDYFGCADPEAKVPFLTLPTACTGPEEYSAIANEWANGANEAGIKVISRDQNGDPIGLVGCEALHFGPEVSVAPDTSEADTPAGLSVELGVSQEGLLAAGGVATSNIRDTTVVLPEGVVINPGQATGLAACGLGSAESGVGTEGPAHCPLASKVGTVEIETPLLKSALKGNVYVLRSNPPNIKLLVAPSGEGVNLKLVGDVHLDEKTGRLTSTFADTPELPFTKFTLAFSGGARAALATPTRCGSYVTASDFTPWSSPFVSDVYPSSEFLLSSGVGGSACPASGSLPFAPQLTAGSTTDQAGGYTDFSMLLTRADGQQRIGALQFKTPEGLLGEISKASLCPEPEAATGECPASSQIGHTVVEAGPGPFPLVVPEPGQPPAPIYLTGSYEGAPYGLTIKVPLHVGPFVLTTQIVRAKIEVNPITTQLTITTDPLPQVIDGVPSDLREINAVIDRPGFMINPTNCNASSFSGTASGAPVPGSGEAPKAAAISSRFQVGSCRSLTFKPGFSATTSANSSRRNGASLQVRIVYPKGEAGPGLSNGGQASIGRVHVELPKALPSRLSTLQKACTERQFAVNPAGCPSESMVGHAVAHTPLLKSPLVGPAYFVSHGGAKFPELIMVLQGEGITIELAGETFISKAGITSSTFEAVPDAPVSSFELTLPEGRYSALAAPGNKLCSKQSSLAMPTELVGQNGAVMQQSTMIAVEGCRPAIVVLKRKVKGSRARLALQVPSAGKLAAWGKGIASASKQVRHTGGHAKRVALTIHLTRRERARLAARHGKRAGRVEVKVHLSFNSRGGRKLTKTIKLRMVTAHARHGGKAKR